MSKPTKKEKSYMNWVRSLPCAITGYEGEIDPSHLEGMSWLTGKCAGKKGHYLSCIPMRHKLHVELHRIGWKSFERKYNVNQLELAFKTILEAEKYGVINIEKVK